MFINLLPQLHLNLGIRRLFIKFSHALDQFYAELGLWLRYLVEKTICFFYFNDLTVVTGNFAGLRYHAQPKPKETYSTFLPKLAGVYEKELRPIIEKILQMKFDSIINIGSDDGYYAVGLGKFYSEAVISLFDISVSALKYSRRLAKNNGLKQGKFKLSSVVNHKTISNAIRKKTLIVCDCEGCELELIDPVKNSKLRNCVILLEVHDAIHHGLSQKIVKRFKTTHLIRKVMSDKSVEKGLKGYFRKLIFSEMRSAEVFWFFMTPKI